MDKLTCDGLSRQWQHQGGIKGSSPQLAIPPSEGITPEYPTHPTALELGLRSRLGLGIRMIRIRD